MVEIDLVREVQKLANDLSRRTTMWQFLFRENTSKGIRILLEHDTEMRERAILPRPATSEQVVAAQDSLGFAVPPLLARLWTEVANGGFGPGYGLLGVEGGFADGQPEMTAVESYLSQIADTGYAVAFGLPWPPKVVPICYWGCDHYTALDCATLEGEMVDFPEGTPDQLKRRAMTFAQWMEAWVNGVELWPWECPR
jgi:hypothetical protein